jgi:hypothetical protein
MREWIWECPNDGCNAHGIKPLSHHKALHNGKWHLIHTHRTRDKEPIVRRV